MGPGTGRGRAPACLGHCDRFPGLPGFVTETGGLISVTESAGRIWGCPAGPWHKIWRQAAWLAALLAYIFAEATVGTVTNGGLVATGAVAVLAGLVFFWWGLRFLPATG